MTAFNDAECDPDQNAENAKVASWWLACISVFRTFAAVMNKVLAAGFHCPESLFVTLSRLLCSLMSARWRRKCYQRERAVGFPAC